MRMERTVNPSGNMMRLHVARASAMALVALIAFLGAATTTAQDKEKGKAETKKKDAPVIA